MRRQGLGLASQRGHGVFEMSPFYGRPVPIPLNLVYYTYPCPQDSLDHNTCLHIAKLTNLVSLFIDDIDMWMDEPVSFLAMLSNLTHLETLHLYSISNTTCVDMVSPVFDSWRRPR